MKDPYIDKKMQELSNIYKMYSNTSGDIKVVWCNKWYELVRKISEYIQNSK